jgi:heme/copper-type cytochrome/quinol oxidase subunit 4
VIHLPEIMEEIEIPTEHLHETIHEKAEEAKKEKEGGWNMYVAISTALIAVLAAISGLMAGHHSNEALIQQIKASDQWAYYQAKGIKAEIKSITQNNPQDKEAFERYKKEQESIKEKAESAQNESELHLAHHVKLAGSVTLFQIAIAVSAIAILTRKKILWYASLLVAIIGAIFFVMGLI